MIELAAVVLVIVAFTLALGALIVLVYTLGDALLPGIFRHHRCDICDMPRPIWMRGNHTTCVEFMLDQLHRECDEVPDACDSPKNRGGE